MMLVLLSHNTKKVHFTCVLRSNAFWVKTLNCSEKEANDSINSCWRQSYDFVYSKLSTILKYLWLFYTTQTIGKIQEDFITMILNCSIATNPSYFVASRNDGGAVRCPSKVSHDWSNRDFDPERPGYRDKYFRKKTHSLKN